MSHKHVQFALQCMSCLFTKWCQTEVKIKSKIAHSNLQVQTFQFSNESIFVLDVPAFRFLIENLLQYHNAMTHQIYSEHKTPMCTVIKITLVNLTIKLFIK